MEFIKVYKSRTVINGIDIPEGEYLVYKIISAEDKLKSKRHAKKRFVLNEKYIFEITYREGIKGSSKEIWYFVDHEKKLV